MRIPSPFKKLFKILYGALGEEAVYQFYPDLVKCLDDSSDSIRFATCNTLKQFLRAAPYVKTFVAQQSIT